MRSYTRSGEPEKCSVCKLPRTIATDHQQSKGHWYCQTTDNRTVEEWRVYVMEIFREKKEARGDREDGN